MSQVIRQFFRVGFGLELSLVKGLGNGYGLSLYLDQGLG